MASPLSQPFCKTPLDHPESASGVARLLEDQSDVEDQHPRSQPQSMALIKYIAPVNFHVYNEQGSGADLQLRLPLVTQHPELPGLLQGHRYMPGIQAIQSSILHANMQLARYIKPHMEQFVRADPYDFARERYRKFEMWKMISKCNDTYTVGRPCFLYELPNELLVEIFKYLGPASRRIFGATSSLFYQIWKSEHYEKSIRVHCDESAIMDELIEGQRILYNTSLSSYSKIIMQWMSPQFLPLGRYTREYCTKMLNAPGARISMGGDSASGRVYYKTDLALDSDRIMEYNCDQRDAERYVGGAL